MTQSSANGTVGKTYKVGVIIGSQRVRRVGPQITDFVFNTIKAQGHPEITLQLIDVAALNLPLYDESGIPSRIYSTEDYDHEHTRVWARTIAALDAFVFVTPQYNWGIPAGLKNAIDYLFNEWKGKPAMIVSYGGHGGDKCAAHLKQVLAGGIDMLVVDETVNLAFPNRDFLVKATMGKELGLDASNDEGVWAKERGQIVDAWQKMVKMLGA
jgi:NAD(P)H-dependent FMN reductase